MTNRRNHLRPILKRAGLTQRQFAGEVGITPERLSAIANGRAWFGEMTERRIIVKLRKHLPDITNEELALALGFPSPLADRTKGAASRDACVLEFPGRRVR